METRDEKLIASLIPQNEELRQLMENHDRYENQLVELNKRPYLTTEEALEKKVLQKQKLAGRDRIEAILAEYRQGQDTE